MSFLKQKKVLIAIAVVVLILLGGGAYFVLGSNKAPAPQDALMQTEAIPTITPDSIGLTVTIRDDKKAMKFAIANTKDITGIEYSIAYTVNQKGTNVQQGLIGDIAPDASGKIETQYREFGTCSSGTCRYDTVVSPITLTLKITKSNGQVYQTIKTVTL